MALYDALAAQYQHGMARITGLHACDLADALALRAGDHALDVAAGTGSITEVLAERVGPSGTVLAVDVAAGMLGIARRRLLVRHRHVRCALGAAEMLPVANRCVDAVACAFGIQHVDEPDAALREMHRVLKPGGRCAVAVWAAVDKDIKSPIDGAFALLNPTRPLSPAQETWATPGALARRLRDVGFVDVQERTSTGSLPVASFDEWWDAITSGRLGDRLRAVGPQSVARVREEAYRRAETFATRVESGWRFPSAAVVVSGMAP